MVDGASRETRYPGNGRNVAVLGVEDEEVNGNLQIPEKQKVGYTRARFEVTYQGLSGEPGEEELRRWRCSCLKFEQC